MVVQIITYVFVGLMAGLIGAILALRIQHRYWKNILAGHEGWEHAQEGHHRSWEAKQELIITEAESRLAAQVQQLRQEWQHWETKDQERIAAQAQLQQLSEEQARLEHELARLPRVEETPISVNGKRQRQQTGVSWQPALLHGANLEGKDLSYRYLGRADMRNANLSHANLFMADLSGACLADTDLTDADLSGANLSHADLRNAILKGTNLLVADLNNTILTGADVLNARNLTTKQLYSAIYDSTTQVAGELDVTMPRMFSVRPSLPHTLPKTDLPVAQDAQHSAGTIGVTVDIPSRETVEATPVPIDLTAEPSENVATDVTDSPTSEDNVATDTLDSWNNGNTPALEQPEQHIDEPEATTTEQDMIPETPVPAIPSDIPYSAPHSVQETMEPASTAQPAIQNNGNKSKHQTANTRPGIQNGNGKNNSRIKYNGRKRAKVS